MGAFYQTGHKNEPRAECRRSESCAHVNRYHFANAHRGEATRVPMSRKRITATKSALKTKPRAGPAMVKPSSRAAPISLGGRMLDMRKSSLAYLSASTFSSLGKQTGGAGELDKWALNIS